MILYYMYMFLFFSFFLSFFFSSRRRHTRCALVTGVQTCALPISAVIVLTVLHMTAARWRRDFAADANRHSERFYRIMNEVPALLMVAIVIFVVVRPF